MSDKSIQPKTDVGPLDEIRQQVAEQTGEAPDHIRLVELQLDMLLRAGVLVDIDGTGVSMFTIRAPWEVWGVPESSARRSHLTSGSLSVFPKKLVNGVRSRIQAAVNALDNRYSFHVRGLPGRWVPYTAYRAWLDDFNRRVADLEQYVQQQFLDCYDDLVQEAERDAARMAHEAYNALRALDNWIELGDQIAIDISGIAAIPIVRVGDVVMAKGNWGAENGHRTFRAFNVEILPPDAASEETQKGETWVVGTVTLAGSGLGNITPEEFVENMVTQVRQAIPTPEAIRERLKLSYSTAALVNPAVVEAELAHRDEIRRVRQAAQEAEDQEYRLNREREEAEKRQIWAQARLAELELENRQQQLEEMRQLEREHYRQQLAQMASPVMAIFNNLRAQMHDGAQAVLAALQSGRANGPARRKARSMVAAFRLLNGLDDEELDHLISQADALLSQPQTDPADSRSLEGVMKDIVALTAQAAADVQIAARQGGRWRGLRPVAPQEK